MSQISLRNVYKSFGTVQVIDNISLDIREGELMVFVGPSGCGKSTLLRLIAGLDRPTRGDICIGGEVVNQRPAADRGLAMVFQSYALYPHMTVRQNLSFGLENAKLPRAQISERIVEAARLLDISELMDRRPGQLSGGQRQRVAIGRAIVRSPTAFLLDEPLSNLDAKLRVVMRAELSALHARLKKTMVYVTHDQVEAMTLADRIVVLRDGRIEQVGTPLELYNTPQNRFVAGFIGAPGMNFLAARIQSADGQYVSAKLPSGDSLKVRGNGITAAPGEEITLGIRPQDIELISTGTKGLEVEATLVEAIGSETIVHTQMASGERLLCVLSGQKAVRVGSKVRLGFNEQNLHFFDNSGSRLARS